MFYAFLFLKPLASLHDFLIYALSFFGLASFLPSAFCNADPLYVTRISLLIYAFLNNEGINTVHITCVYDTFYCGNTFGLTLIIFRSIIIIKKLVKFIVYMVYNVYNSVELY